MPLRLPVLAIVLASTVHLGGTAFAQAKPVQPTPTTKTVSAGEFLQAPRELRRQLKGAREALEKKDYAALAEMLGALAEPLAKEDFLVFEAGKPLGMGLKTERQELFHKMPDEGWDTFDTLHGQDANRALQAAVEQGSLVQLEAVAQRWAYTEAGDHATLLVARRALDEHRWDDASRRLSGLVQSPRGSRYDPEASVLLASALLMQGHDERAAAILQSLRGRNDDARVRIGAEQVRLFERDPLDTLRTHLAGLDQLPSARRWAPPQIDGQAIVAAAKREGAKWENETVDIEKDRANVQQLVDGYKARSAPALGFLKPTFLGEQIVHRTSERLVAVDRAGKTLWAYPFDYESARVTTVKPVQPAGIRIRMPAMPANSIAQQRLRERLWSDHVYGRFTTNQRYIFAIDRLPPTTDPRTMSNLRFQVMRRNNKQTEFKVERFSRLVALDAERGGALVWAVGDKTGYMEPLLAKSFFLGPPLAMDGRLYALIEREEVVELVALDDATGRFIWSLKIAQMANRSIGLDAGRRLQGATPVLHNGLLICPTSAGGICAIDPVSRSFRWGSPSQTVTGTTGRTSPTRFAYAPPPGSDWAEVRIQVAGERLVYTQRGGTLRCLNADTGEDVWSRPRRDMVTVGCVTDKAVLLIGQYRMTAVRLEDGEPAWDTPYVAIPAGGAPAGHGVCDGESYFLPTTDPELLKIDVATGAIERIRLSEPWGNLAANGKLVVEQSPLKLKLRSGAGKSTAAQTMPDEEIAKLDAMALVDLFQDSRFAVRESAAKQLSTLREKSIDALATGVQLGDAETAYRSRGVLLAFIRDDDETLSEVAKAALQEAEKNSATLIGATSIEDEIAGQSEKALQRLRSNGAIVGNNGQTVVIRQTWRGTAKDLTALKWLTQLRTLELTHKDINDETIDHIKNLEALTSLNLRGAGVSDAGIAKLSALTNLRTLLLQDTSTTNAAIDDIAKHKKLLAINLLNTKVTQEGIRKLKALLPRAQVIH